MRFVPPCIAWLVASGIVVATGDVSVATGERLQNASNARKSLGSAEQRTSDDVPTNSVPQNFPCRDQPKSLNELKDAFKQGRIPSRSETTGFWVSIGFFGDDSKSLNYTGITRGNKLFEQVMLANQYSIEMHGIGTEVQTRTLAPDNAGSLTFPFDFGGDASPVYRCRLSARKTLLCLIDVYRQGEEFKKMSVTPEQIPTYVPVYR